MNSYNFFKDILDTYQSFGPLIQLAWLVVPCATVAFIFWLWFRYRLERNEQEARRAELDREINKEARRSDAPTGTQQDLHPYLWEDQRSGRVVAYHVPIPDAPTLMALLDEIPNKRDEGGG